MWCNVSDCELHATLLDFPMLPTGMNHCPPIHSVNHSCHITTDSPVLSVGLCMTSSPLVSGFKPSEDSVLIADQHCIKDDGDSICDYTAKHSYR